ncbi:MAG: SUMF1/EgtB/PvdO family nonheme iron enzyme [Terrimicrobiaceae bacterium]
MIWALVANDQAQREKARALDLVRFMDTQIGEAFTNVPVQLRERIGDRLEAFYQSQGEPTTFIDRNRRMGQHMRKAMVHLAVVERYQKGDFTEAAKKFYIDDARKNAMSELEEALRLGDILAGEAPGNREIARDRILTQFHMAMVSTQLEKSEDARRHLNAARTMLDELVKAGPFSLVLYVDWMGLPNLDAAMGDLAWNPDDSSTSRTWYEKALELETALMKRRPADSEHDKELKRIKRRLESPTHRGHTTGKPGPSGQRAMRLFLSVVIGVVAGVSLPLCAQDVFNAAGYTDRLGMKFVPVPGTQVLFSAYETRVKDFRTFVEETGYVHMRETEDEDSRMWSVDRDGEKQRGHSWEDPGFRQTDDHPVVGVSWYDAKAFCEWLTLRERAAGRLPPDREYRLPTDHEWSVAVGLDEDPSKSPEEKDGKITDAYPQGNWPEGQPPPQGAGNYAGMEINDEHWPEQFSWIERYNDGYARTASGGSFKPSQFGLYDMGGNVWEWCEDEYRPGESPRVLRGASWRGVDRVILLSSNRNRDLPGIRRDNLGYRCVVGASSPKAGRKRPRKSGLRGAGRLLPLRPEPRCTSLTCVPAPQRPSPRGKEAATRRDSQQASHGGSSRA